VFRDLFVGDYQKNVIVSGKSRGHGKCRDVVVIGTPSVTVVEDYCRRPVNRAIWGWEERIKAKG
jgi:hypothetical protein